MPSFEQIFDRVERLHSSSSPVKARLHQNGLARKIGAGDVIINPPGTPHWLSEIEGEIEYVEIRVPNVDPAPGVERAEIAPAKQSSVTNGRRSSVPWVRLESKFHAKYAQ